MSAVEMLGRCRDRHCGATATSGKLCHAFTCRTGCMLTAGRLCSCLAGLQAPQPTPMGFAGHVALASPLPQLCSCSAQKTALKGTGSGMPLIFKVGLTAVLLCTHAMASISLPSHRGEDHDRKRIE